MPIYLGSHKLTTDQDSQSTEIELFNLLEVDSSEIRSNDRLVFYGTVDAVIDGQEKQIESQIQLPIVAGDNIQFNVENNKLKISSTQSSVQSVSYGIITFEQLFEYMEQIYSQGKTIIGGDITFSYDENVWNNASYIMGAKTNLNTTAPAISISSITDISAVNAIGRFFINVSKIGGQFTVTGYASMNSFNICDFFNSVSQRTVSFSIKVPYTINGYTATYNCQYDYSSAMINSATLIYG